MNNKKSPNSDDVCLFDYDKVYNLLDTLSLKQLYFVMDILPDLFWKRFYANTAVCPSFPERLIAYNKCVSRLHKSLGYLKTSDLTRICLYIERLCFKSRVRTDEDFIDSLLNQVLDDVSHKNK
jgi:hypothetical protein